jgi:hypothetical protein
MSRDKGKETSLKARGAERKFTQIHLISLIWSLYLEHRKKPTRFLLPTKNGPDSLLFTWGIYLSKILVILSTLFKAYVRAVLVFFPPYSVAAIDSSHS